MEYKKVESEIGNIVNDNVKKLAQLFPAAVKDGEVDFEALKEELGQFQEVNSEKYELTWAGKQNAKKIAQEDIVGKTLKYIPEESKDADTTENLYIEGDNLEVLKLLRQNYYGAIKMIYIDPPYNTGNDFIYNDDFKMQILDSNIAEGNISEGGEHLVINTKSQNRYHANWLTMMYSRLRLAKDLLTEDGAIFVSIDDIEVDNLKKICNEIFNDNNFVAQLVWEKKKKGAFLSKNFINMKEYVLVYAKNISEFGGLIGEVNEDSETYPCIKTTNARGVRIIRKGTISRYKESDYVIKPNTRISAGNMELIYLSELEVKDGIVQKDVEVDSNWIYGQDKLDLFTNDGLLYITQDLYIRRIVNDSRVKMLKDLLQRVGTDGKSLPRYEYDINLNNGGWGTNEDANDELHQLLGTQNLFDFSKPSRLIGKLIQSMNIQNAVIMDFFSGSATTAQAVMEFNSCMDVQKRNSFLLVQIPETISEEKLSIDSSYKNICELARKRIDEAGNKMVKIKDLDIGFKTFKLANTNIKWNSSTTLGQLDMNQIETTPDLVDFMSGAKDIDIVYELMLRQRDVPLSAPMERLEYIGKRTYLYASSYMVCLESEITAQLVDKLAAINPLPIKFIFRDSAFKDDIALKDETMRRLKTLVEKNSGESRKTYTVEFI